jgi:hypothetical protein
MIADIGIKSKYSSFLEAQFWICGLLGFPVLTNTVLKILLPFPATYDCEVGFSTSLQIKTKHRSRLSVEGGLQCALSSTSLRVKKLQAVKQTFPLGEFLTSTLSCFRFLIKKLWKNLNM